MSDATLTTLQSLENIRQRLLDLSKRNQLLNYKEKARTVHIVDTKLDNLFNQLVQEGKGMTFAPLPIPKTPQELTTISHETLLLQASIPSKSKKAQASLLRTAHQEEVLTTISYETLSPPASRPSNSKKAQASLLRTAHQEEVLTTISYETLSPPASRPSNSKKAQASLLRTTHQEEVLTTISHETLPPPAARPSKSKKATDSLLHTAHHEEVLERRCQKLAREARTSIEETGRNLLYLAVGFLEWYQNKHTTEPIKAPLILIPVKLERVRFSTTYQYVLSSRDEDIETNISLAEKLANDFNLVLPVFSDNSEPEAYLAQVTEMAKKIPSWQVIPDIRLDLFSFTKLLMYKDLTSWPANAKLHDNANLKQILVGNSTTDVIPPLDTSRISLKKRELGGIVERSGKTSANLLETGELGDICPIDIHPLAEKTPLILDADSSQQTVIMDALWNGKNLVVEGPPGTGKSQTITNLIAAALAQDKSVLFVAEKKAALDVVSSRLENVGLGEFCLELHSHKTQKSVFHANLKKRLNKEYQDATQLDVDIKALAEQKKRLLAYSNLVNTRVGPNNKRLYEIFWAVEKLRGELAGENLRFKLQNPFLSRDDFNHKMNKLTEFAEQYEALSDTVILNWQGFKPTKIWPGDEEIIQGILSSLFLETQTYDADLAVLIEETKIPLTTDLAALQSFTQINVAEIKSIPTPFDSAAAVQLFNNKQTLERIRQFQLDQKEYQQLLSQATQFLGQTEYPVKFLQRVLNETSKLDKLGLGNDSPNELLVLSKNVEKLDQELRSLLENPESVENFLKFLQLRELAEQAPPDLVINKHSAHAQEATPIVFQYARDSFAELSAQWADKKNDFLLNKLPSSKEIAILADELRKHRANWLAFLSGDYRRAKRAVNAFLATRRFNLRQLINALEALAALKRQTEQETQRAQYQQLFGGIFLGIETDWALLEQHIDWAQTLANVLGAEEAQELLATKADPCGHLIKSTAVMYEQWLRVSKAAEQLNVACNSDLLVNEFVEQILERYRFVKQIVSRLQQQLPHLTDKHIVSTHNAVQNLLTARQIRLDADQNSFLQQLFGKAYQGIETNAIAQFALADWLTHLQTAAKLPAPLLLWLISKDTARRLSLLKALSTKNKAYLALLHEHCQKLAEFGELNTQQWFHCTDKPCTLTQIAKTAHTCQNSVNLLGTLSLFYVIKQELDKMALKVITDAITTQQIKPKSAPLHFQYAVYQSLGRELIRKHDLLARFTRTGYENLRQRVVELDKKVQKAFRQRIAYQTAQKPIPEGNSAGRVATFTEKSLIEHELNKKRRHIPIRQLVRRATKALQAMKPCFMMSPLSVAQYLAPGQIEFDLLIIDEASQVRPEDALGAIARCKQIIIVGDPKQLPPTQFFERLVNEEEEETTALEGQESILDSCLSTYQKGWLRWHYRSEHESLIAFSNHHFYDNELIVFPAPVPQHQGCGVRLNYVENATYFKGRNQKEAETVVAAVAAHFKNTPALSLGVATFNMRQQALISELLEQRCQAEPLLEKQIKLTENTTEPFFIKNLENVQGDERDIIFVSTTYGADPETGKVFQRFGPISHDMGWRRLNVIFTRAKKRLELFTSMRSSDIQPKAKRGVQILKTYLEYAETGKLPSDVSTIPQEVYSDFQLAVSQILQKHGYETVLQVGVAGFRIDIGVLHPEKSGEYILGIACDGANYHFAKSLRDRDRLQQEILESKGWTIYRIWALDWFKHRDAEIERLLKTLDGFKTTATTRISCR
jgi:hypothetical protein